MSTELHEPAEHLSEALMDVKRAIDSMREELEAVDWYRQRAEACRDARLKAILDHHQREELEHFAMLLEWCRRNDADFAAQLRTYLFTDRPILDVEDTAEAARAGEAAPERRGAATARVTLGGLRGARALTKEEPR
jgi:hypothetical protein